MNLPALALEYDRTHAEPDDEEEGEADEDDGKWTEDKLLFVLASPITAGVDPRFPRHRHEGYVHLMRGSGDRGGRC